MMNPAYQIRMVKENLDLSVALFQAVQDDKVTAKQIFRDGPEEMFVAFAVNKHGPDQIELRRRVANQTRSAFVFSVIQTQRSLERVFSNAPIDERNPDLQAARCVLYLLSRAVSHNFFTPVWDCPPQYCHRFEVRPINLLIDAAELHGKGLSWNHVGGLPQFIELLQYFANQIEDLPEIERSPISPPIFATVIHPPEAVANAPAENPIQAVLEEPKVMLANPALSNASDAQVARFIAERCDLGTDLRIIAKEIYTGYLEWCRETDQDDLSQRSFGMQLSAMGLCRRRRGRGKHWWEGLRLRQSDAKEVTGPLGLSNGHHRGYQLELSP